MKELIQAVINSPAVEIFGFYSRECLTRSLSFTMLITYRLWSILRI